MQGKAGQERFNHLHNILTEALIAKIESGEATAAEMKTAADWLSKNNVTGVAFNGSPLDRLRLVVPQIEREDVERRVSGT